MVTAHIFFNSSPPVSHDDGEVLARSRYMKSLEIHRRTQTGGNQETLALRHILHSRCRHRAPYM